MWYFGNFNLKVRFCGFIETFGLRFLSVLFGSQKKKFFPGIPLSGNETAYDLRFSARLKALHDG